jgi:hypothetical protein
MPLWSLGGQVRGQRAVEVHVGGDVHVLPLETQRLVPVCLVSTLRRRNVLKRPARSTDMS